LHATRNGAPLSNKPAKGSGQHRAWISQWLVDSAEDIGVEVHRLQRDKFLAWANEREPNASLRPSRDDCDVYGNAEGLGAWSNLRAYVASQAGKLPEPTIAELGFAREVANDNRYRRALERAVGDDEFYARRLTDALVAAVERCPPSVTPKRPVIESAVPQDRAIVAHLSDCHFGCETHPEEVLGGKYNWEIAARRMGLFAWQIGEFKREKGRERTLHLIANGDLTEGVIHQDDRGIDPLAVQLDGMRQILTSLLDYLRTSFARIHVHFTTGNHGRWIHRDGGRRPSAQKWDSADTTVYRAVEATFRHCPDVTFDIPRTPFCRWTVCGHRYLATHGDSVLSMGQPSKSIKFDSLFSKLYHLESNEALGGERFAAIAMGHLHHPMVCRVPGRAPHPYLTINGAASGRTNFSQTMGFASSPPSQTMWEVTTDHAIGDFRIVDLERADNDPRFSQIVPTPVRIGEPLPKVAV
jgi:hypothetical protein